MGQGSGEGELAGGHASTESKLRQGASSSVQIGHCCSHRSDCTLNLLAGSVGSAILAGRTLKRAVDHHEKKTRAKAPSMQSITS